jgi:hypothetical protein
MDKEIGKQELKGAYKNTYKCLEEAQKEHDELQRLVDEHKEIIEKIKEILIEIDR